MASKVKTREAGLRKITKPVISSDVMGNRNVEVRAVGAWVQPASLPFQSQAVVAAREEEDRLMRMKMEKEARLQRFQDDVRQRVKALEKLKKQQQMEKSFKAIEHERHIVKQSAFAGDNLHPRKDNCVLRQGNSLSIKQALSPTTKGRPASASEVDKHQAFEDQTNQIRNHTAQARRKLGSRQIFTEEFFPDDLPGGIWRVSKTRDHPVSRSTGDAEVIDLEDNDEFDKEEEFDANSEHEYEDKENKGKTSLKMVHFNLDSAQEETRKDRIQRKSATTISGTQVTRTVPSVHVPDIYIGVINEEEKQRQKSQHAMFRRLFMDIEREQVKENLRRKEHRKTIQRLKKEKEDKRRQEEDFQKKLIEPRDPVTGETSQEVLVREKCEKQHVKQTVEQHEQKLKRAREMERYVDALRQQLREKINNRGVQLPSLCCCGDTVWDTNPDTCANNCVFYKNPRGYAKALQSLLVSCELA